MSYDRVILALLLVLPAVFGQKTELLQGPLDEHWERVGPAGQWWLKDGVLLGKRTGQGFDVKLNPKTWMSWYNGQAWLYSRREFTPPYTFEAEYLLKRGGNSGISIGDKSRAKYAVTNPPDFSKTPSKLAYEIQLNRSRVDTKASGSIYGLADAKGRFDHDGWNKLKIEVLPHLIKVWINDQLAAEHPGVEGRDKSGPIGIQLHDRNTEVQFRNLVVIATDK